MRSAEEIIRLPRRTRQRLNLRGKKRKRVRHPPCTMSREELVEYLKKNDIRSMVQLEAKRSHGDPRLCDFKREFGSWSNVKFIAFEDRPDEPITIEYVLKTIVFMDIQTREQYWQARSADPEIVPAYYHIRKNFGKWSTAKETARRYSLKYIFSDYLKLKRALGRTPTMKECEAEGIDVKTLRAFYGSRKELEKVEEMLGVK